ncbi:Actin patch protein 1 [Lachancea thermotolerans]|uniref:KLTH0G08140p n=1 Tax=Lachancea thermotolerans (strain ATCC 56472 / CBS 6340 / NRRL Y-8284) TaxID=559295 RepID=C5DME3_LACTC|nr:KLTH0G08140p [Lachancea thermotolerans CBS 6340]CAR24954.1 KLTH0G08140p [Lachancea thermotolerans CBS 6340]
MNNSDEYRGTGSLNRRQRLMNIMKTTRDAYIPAFTTTLSQFRSEASSTIKGYYDSANHTGATQGVRTWPVDMKTLIYPSYTRMVDQRYFETHIRGLVFSPGTMNRKSRLILSLCRQLVRPSSPSERAALEEQLEAPLNDSQSISDSASTHSSLSLDNSDDDTLRSRISGFLHKHIMGVTLTIDISDGSSLKERTSVVTDNYGNYDVKVATQFQPQNITINIDTKDGCTVNCPINIVKDQGFALISDVDDTIKHTGVTGDKRSMFSNVFVHEFKTWAIPGMSLWYNTLKDSEGVDFFYVSNSPFQIYPVLEDYVSKHFPMGPLFLKQYSGNLVSSLMSSSAKRKLGTILGILADFPHKRFILVGDSGEGDLEAYTEAVKLFPNQILGVYIRCCKDSMSDVAAYGHKVIDELNALIEKKYYSKTNIPSTSGEVSSTRKDLTKSPSIPDLIQLDDVKTPPLKPTKKPMLTSAQRQEIESSKKAQPPLPPRKHRTFPSSIKEPSTVNRSATDDAIYYTPSSQNDYGSYPTFFDSKADSWRQRVVQTIKELKNCNAQTRLQFFTEPELCLEDSIETIRKEKARNIA